MIKCKEDIMNTTVSRDDIEVFELFMDKCEEFGIKWYNGQNPRESERGDYIIFGGSVLSNLTQSNNLSSFTQYKKLTLEDFQDEKPSKQYKYEEFKGSMFELEEDLQEGNLVYKNKSVGYVVVESEKRLCNLIIDNETLYIREEVDWRQNVMDYLGEYFLKNSGSLTDMARGFTNMLYEPHLAYEKQEFIKLCHYVAESTENHKKVRNNYDYM